MRMQGEGRAADEAASGLRTAGATGALALLALLALAFFAPRASAEPLEMKFSEGRVNVGIQLSDAALFQPPEVAPFEAQIDPASGSISAGAVDVPEFSTHITDPIDSDVTVEVEIGVLGGGFDRATGALTLNVEAGGTLAADEQECVLSTDPPVLDLSTAGSSGGTNPRSGAPFANGLTGRGEIAGQWTNMSATPIDPDDPQNVSFCGNVEHQVSGPGGMWLLQEGDTVPPPAPRLLGTIPASPSLRATARILGAAEPGSVVHIFPGAGCATLPVATGSAAHLSWPGFAVHVAAGATAAFSASATDAAGNTSACAAPIAYTRLQLAPPPPPPPRRPRCVVPKLAGKKLKRAKRAVRAAGCRVGKVRRPKWVKGKRRRALVVKASNPRAGASPANRKVHLKLGLKRSKPPRADSR